MEERQKTEKQNVSENDAEFLMKQYEEFFPLSYQAPPVYGARKYFEQVSLFEYSESTYASTSTHANVGKHDAKLEPSSR